MSNVKKVVLKQSRKKKMDGVPVPLPVGHPANRSYEVVGLENTIGYEIGEVLSKDDVQRLICKPSMKVVIK